MNGAFKLKNATMKNFTKFLGPIRFPYTCTTCMWGVKNPWTVPLRRFLGELYLVLERIYKIIPTAYWKWKIPYVLLSVNLSQSVWHNFLKEREVTISWIYWNIINITNLSKLSWAFDCLLFLLFPILNGEAWELERWWAGGGRLLWFKQSPFIKVVKVTLTHNLGFVCIYHL